MSAACSSLLALLLGIAAALGLSADDPRWRMRESVQQYLNEVQKEREVRLAARIRQYRLEREFSAFAAELCLPEPAMRLRSAGPFAAMMSSLNERRKLELDRRDTWTRELEDGSVQQHWEIVEHQLVPRGLRFGEQRYEWQEKVLPIVFLGRQREDGSFAVRPEWNEDRRVEDRLPPHLHRLLELLGPDGAKLASSGFEARR